MNYLYPGLLGKGTKICEVSLGTLAIGLYLRYKNMIRHQHALPLQVEIDLSTIPGCDDTRDLSEVISKPSKWKLVESEFFQARLFSPEALTPFFRRYTRPTIG